MSKRQLIISDKAADDLSDIWLYIANDHPETADRFIDQLYAKCLLLCENTEIGRRRDEVMQGLRSFPVKRYTIFYRVNLQNIEIIRILSGYRDIETLF